MDGGEDGFFVGLDEREGGVDVVFGDVEGASEDGVGGKRGEEVEESFGVGLAVDGASEVAGVIFDGFFSVDLVDVVPVFEEPGEGAVTGVAPAAEAEEEAEVVLGLDESGVFE